MNEQNTHSKLAPSGASRWTECTASVKLIEDAEEQSRKAGEWALKVMSGLCGHDEVPEEWRRALIVKQDTTYSEEGTIAHQWAGDILQGLSDISEVPEDMQPHVQAYVDFVRGITKEEDEVFIESSVPLFYKPEDTGTVDYCVVGPKRVYVADLKYGVGVIVDAKDNKQLAIYARSMVEHIENTTDRIFEPDTLIIIAIFQPRTHEENPIKLWSLPLVELMEFTEGIWTKVEEISSAFPNVRKFSPGDKTCQFCDAKSFCGARSEMLLKHIPGDPTTVFENITIDKFVAVPPEGNQDLVLTDDEITALCLNKKAILKFLSDVWSGAQARLEAGQDIEGLKLVMGKEGNRIWSDKGKASQLLSNKLPVADRFKPREVISVAQAEKYFKTHKVELSSKFNTRFKELITRSPGKPTLAFADDKREAIAVSASEVFEDIVEVFPKNVEDDGTGNAIVVTPSLQGDPMA